MAALVGERDQHLRQIERSFPDADIFVRGNRITVSGNGAQRVAGLFDEMILLLQGGQQLDGRTLDRAIQMVEANESPSGVMDSAVLSSARGRVIRPQSAGQRRVTTLPSILWANHPASRRTQHSRNHPPRRAFVAFHPLAGPISTASI